MPMFVKGFREFFATFLIIIGIGLGYTRTTTMGYVGCGLAIVVGLLLQPKISKWYLGLLRNKRQH